MFLPSYAWPSYYSPDWTPATIGYGAMVEYFDPGAMVDSTP